MFVRAGLRPALTFFSRYNSFMPNPVALEPVDYLVIGHVAHDLAPEGPRLGGTAAYSALTALSLGMRVGIVSASGPETSLEPLKDILIILLESPESTTFENIYTEQGRVQYLRAQASRIDFNSVPEAWRRASIIHLAPIADEMDAVLPKGFSPTLLGVTPQGWMRQWDSDERVYPSQWRDADVALAQAGAVVISREDVGGHDEVIEHMAHQTRVLAVTEGAAGAVLYECLVGDVPLTADTPITLIAKVLEEEPRRPSAVQPDIPVALSDLVMWVLAKDREKRPRSAAELHARLDQIALT